jgi:putative ABC transport system permease protein
MDAVRQDLRFGLRLFRRSPGLTLAAVLSMALGIGANTLTFSLVHALLLRSMPFTEPERLVVVGAKPPPEGLVEGRSVSYGDFLDVRRSSRTFSEAGAYFTGLGLTLTEGGEPERVEVEIVSAGLLPLLGTEPLLGRHMRAEEDRWGEERVILLGYDLWQRRFGGDPAIIGRTIQGNSMPFTVIGVMPPGFLFSDQNQDGWVPLNAMAPRDGPNARTNRFLRVIARLRPGVSLQEAEDDTAALSREMAKRFPRTHAGWELRVEPLRTVFVSEELEQSLLFAMGAVVFVLLIACANVANLLQAQAAERRREIAIRAAFGAGPARIARQLLIESGLLAAAGGLLGLALTFGGLALIRTLLPPMMPWLLPRVDAPLLLFTLAMTVGTGLLFGIVPALEASRVDLHTTLKDGARGTGGPRRRRLRSALVVAEVAVSMVLLIGASLFLRSFLSLQASFGEVASERLLSLWIYLPGMDYYDPLVRARRVEDVRARLAALPGVEEVAATNSVPIVGGAGAVQPVLLGTGAPGDCAKTGTQTPAVLVKAGTSGLFQTLDVPLIAGRDLTSAEALTESPAAVVNETMARRLWPGGALGKRFRICYGSSPTPLQVVGVSADLKDSGLRAEEITPTLYISMAHHPGRPVGLILRTSRPEDEILPAARRAVRASDPGLPVFWVNNLARRRDQEIAFDRLFGEGFALFGGIALLLAALGVYGLLAYGVSRRLREIGIRVALGAGRGNVLWLVAGQGVLLTLVGTGLGLLTALLAARSIEGLLYGVSPTDTASFVGMAILLVDVAFIACYLPARRALDVDPVEILRGE